MIRLDFVDFRSLQGDPDSYYRDKKKGDALSIQIQF